MSHTKGDWHISVIHPYYIHNSQMWAIALAYKEDDARLIAAAPMLLTACKEALLDCKSDDIRKLLHDAIDSAEPKEGNQEGLSEEDITEALNQGRKEKDAFDAATQHFQVGKWRGTKP